MKPVLIQINLFLLLITTLSLPAQVPKRYEFKYQKMGTQFKIIVYSADSIQTQFIVNQSIKKIDELNQIFSDYEANSEISQLSSSAGTNKKIKVSPELWYVLRHAKKFSKKSNGAFDISIGPLSKLWRSMFRRKEIFNGVKIKAAKDKVDYQKIKFYPFFKKIKLVQKGMRLDAGGIAKGFTVDEIVKILQQNGFYQILVDGGGDLFIGNPPPYQAGWTIQVRQEDETGTSVKKELILKNIAIASSGDTFRFLEWEGKKYSHIIDPRTGYGVRDQKIINVVASSCMIADAAASTLSVLSQSESQQFLKKMKGLKVY